MNASLSAPQGHPPQGESPQGAFFLSSDKPDQHKQEAVSSKDSHSNDAVRPIHILLVEDDFITQKVMRHLFEGLGCRVEIAGTHAAALNVVEKHVYDFIIMDIGLPDGSGVTLTEEIHCLLDAPPPVIGLSAHMHSALEEQCLAVGMVAAYTKPLSLARAKAWVNQYGAK